MLNKGVEEINNLNREFYSKHNESFDKSRSYGFWKGFEEIINFLPENLKILDLGCGNARFLKFLLEKNIKFRSYLGLDNSVEFVQKNKETYEEYNFQVLDVIEQVEKIDDKYSLIVGFGITHHIPSLEFRKVWFQSLGNIVKNEGFLVLSFWNFDKTKADKNFNPKCYKVEEGDYFLGWKDDYSSHRYCHFFKEYEIKEIIKNLSDFTLIQQFELDQNTYLILQKNS